MSADPLASVVFRHERQEEHRQVETLVREAFWNQYQPGCDEHYLLHQMRGHADYLPELSFVAEQEGRLVAAIAFTRSAVVLTRPPSPSEPEIATVTFGPVAVHPDCQKQGLGRAIITHALQEVARQGFGAVIIQGDCRYYGRLGFRCAERYDVRHANQHWAPTLLIKLLDPSLDSRLLQAQGGVVRESPVFDMQAFAAADIQAFDALFPAKEKIEGTPAQQSFQLMISLTYPVCP
jgi:predicted N-acetyltransferase YhbS